MEPGEQKFELFEDRIFEEASFDIYRGFLKMTVVEQNGTSDGSPWWYPEMMLRLFSNGAESTFRFPLRNPQMIEWLIQALQGMLDKVRNEPGFDRGIVDRHFSGPHVCYKAGEAIKPEGHGFYL